MQKHTAHTYHNHVVMQHATLSCTASTSTAGYAHQ